MEPALEILPKVAYDFVFWAKMAGTDEMELPRLRKNFHALWCGTEGNGVRDWAGGRANFKLLMDTLYKFGMVCGRSQDASEFENSPAGSAYLALIAERPSLRRFFSGAEAD